jgi:hypothetical protein
VPPGLALDRTVLKLAASKNGETVGNGTCAGFVEWALDQAGAKDENDFDPNGDRFNDKLWPNYNYVWGDPVSTLTRTSHSTRGIVPGDILQIRNVEASWFPSTPPPPGTRWKNPYTYGAQHHSAIVAKVAGNTLTLLEQDQPEHEPASVRYTTLNLDGLHSGTIWVYSPVPK